MNALKSILFQNRIDQGAHPETGGHGSLPNLSLNSRIVAGTPLLPAEPSVCPLKIMITIDAVGAWDSHARNEAHLLQTGRLRQFVRLERGRDYCA
ncbi:hypothetical protein A6V36_32875 [Paraburkholderia ginsengiterrae]|uniref:Uncharacterized protein n=1 Tax=Paraburkholderia ginsengiterrae TaxID=1462993 RepID=A0ABX2US64_9BURK|nr:hypothetical protein A6V36_32875 [Paraburkholderia ginsengiterrae]